MPQPKIVIIGGGSYQWGPTFLRDIFIHPQLQGSKVVLHDINPEPLDLIFSLAQKLISILDCDFTIQKTLDLDEALQSADFVILTISTGGLETMRHDLEIPEKYGIFQSVGDTVGPGGLSRALRNIPVVISIAEKMEEICPNAWLLNYTNPMTTLTRVVNQISRIKTIGLCHELIGVRHRLAHLLSIQPSQVHTNVAGINHLIWILDMSIDGKDAFPLLENLAQEILAGRITTGEPEESLSDQFHVKSRLFQIFGALPAAGDRHIAEFFPFFLSDGAERGKKYRVIRTTIEERYDWLRKARTFVEDFLTGRLNPASYLYHASEEAAAPIIAALSTGSQYQGIMNLPNQGQIANLPAGIVVETFGIVSSTGARGIAAGPVPAGIHNVLTRHIENQEMIITAAQTGDRKFALQALANDPLITDLSTVGRMLDELLIANKRYLPQF